MADWPDARLVSAVRDDDVEAFELLYDRYAAPILGFCRHMLSSSTEAEDAVQETFASAFRGLRADGREIELRPWLYAIARNRCLSMLRARRTVDELEDVCGDADSLPELVVRREDLRSLVADVRRLPEEQRTALLLAELADMPHRELAQVLGCRPQKVKALVFQARDTLIADRQARAVNCREVRETLAGEGLAGAGRGQLRRHLRVCEECDGFAHAVRRQRVALALALPVIPSAALKARTLAGALGGGGLTTTATGWVGGSALVGAGMGALLKGLVAVLATGAAAGVSTVAIVNHTRHHGHRARAPSVEGRSARRTQARYPAGGPAGPSGPAVGGRAAPIADGASPAAGAGSAAGSQGQSGSSTVASAALGAAETQTVLGHADLSHAALGQGQSNAADKAQPNRQGRGPGVTGSSRGQQAFGHSRGTPSRQQGTNHGAAGNGSSHSNSPQNSTSSTSAGTPANANKPTTPPGQSSSPASSNASAGQGTNPGVSTGTPAAAALIHRPSMPVTAKSPTAAAGI
jgi:RNA polymerase sigma factor (sigma-70 family)